VGALLDFSQMQPVDTGTPIVAHQVTVTGLNPNPQIVNPVYIRCASASGNWALQYRAVAPLSGNFPRIGSIWGDVYANQPSQAAKIQLYNSLGMSFDRISALRAANPGVLILASDDATYSGPWAVFPDDYYLKDTQGNNIQVGPDGASMLNMTRPDVAEGVANYFYQQLVGGNLAWDGFFLDDVFTTISWLNSDFYGNPVQISSANNGIADNPATLDAAWRAGLFLELNTLRNLVPSGYFTGHLTEPADPQLMSLFNGNSLVFDAVDVREGNLSFGDFRRYDQSWFLQGVSPGIAAVQSAPPSILSYGYGPQPAQTLPASTLAFAESFYPNMRFGLASALMNDGFSTYDLGDEGCCAAWWYDEYDFNLGQPLGPAVRIGSGTGPNLLANAGFENGLSGWSFFVDDDGQASAAAASDSSVAAEGNASAHIDVTSADSSPWQVNLFQTSLPVTAGANYQVQFWARSDAPRMITVDCVSGNSPYPNYGLDSQVSLDTTWRLNTLTFVSGATAGDGVLRFDVGDVAGNVWIDGVQLMQQAPDIFQRDFSNGVVVLNGTTGWQTVALEPGLQRFTGAQAPLYQYIVDDSSVGFSGSGAWNVVNISTGDFIAVGPWYNAWGDSLHELDVPQGTAQWDLSIPADGQYTIQVWLPDAPGAAGWTKSASYQIVSGGNVVASANLDQTSATGGDQWHTIFSGVALTAAGSPVLTISNAGSGPLIADAVYISSTARYNDGSAAPQVTLAATDGILLQRRQPVAAPASTVQTVVDAAGYQPAIASGGLVAILGSGFTPSPRSPAGAGVRVTIDGIPARVRSTSVGRIDVIAPDDPILGPVPVQVTSVQGASYPGTVVKQKLAPEFFSWSANGTSYVEARHADGTLVGPAGFAGGPALVGEEIDIYGTGFGPTNPPVSPPQRDSQALPLAGSPGVSIGGVAAIVNAAALISPGFYQLTVTVPAVASGNQPVQVEMSGFQSVANAFLACQSQ
jgi:uncharacterized protein (TIGR03437 family)